MQHVATKAAAEVKVLHLCNASMVSEVTTMALSTGCGIRPVPNRNLFEIPVTAVMTELVSNDTFFMYFMTLLHLCSFNSTFDS